MVKYAIYIQQEIWGFTFRQSYSLDQGQAGKSILAVAMKKQAVRLVELHMEEVLTYSSCLLHVGMVLSWLMRMRSRQYSGTCCDQQGPDLSKPLYVT